MIVFADGSTGHPYGGIGVVSVEHVNHQIKITAFGRTLKNFSKVTNQRAELLSIRAAIQLINGRPAVIWSDSQYAIGCLQPEISGWIAKSNLDLCRPIKKEMRASANPIKIYHVKSHIKASRSRSIANNHEVFQLPNFFLHEVADKKAKKAAESGQRETTTLFHNKAHAACLACVFFPCKGDAPHEPCSQHVAWPEELVNNFTEASVTKILEL